MVESTKAKINFIYENLEVQANCGTQLSQIIKVSGADVTFGCRQGTCGICRIKVQKGVENLAPSKMEEKDFLLALNAANNERLACQVVVNGDCEIVYIGK